MTKKPTAPAEVTPRQLAELFIAADDFARLPIPPRTWLAEGAIPHPSLGMLYAYRGVGKTVVSFDLALALAGGRPWLGYDVPQPYTGIYIDGEMPRGDMVDRLRRQCLGAGTEIPHRLHILSAEELALHRMSLNLARDPDRELLSQAIAAWEAQWEASIDFVIIDNWTSLVRGLDENDNSEMDALKAWMILLRHAGISVILVHHAGKGGKHQRGGSAREDVLDYSIRLEKTDGQTRLIWDKVRGARPQPDQFELQFEQDDHKITLARGGDTKTSRSDWDNKILNLVRASGAMHFEAILVALNAPRASIHRALGRLITAKRMQKTKDGLFDID